ncbi:MAG: tRNA threonylcarbamoyladenosine dehydratase [Clostridiales bacterium]|nr:tRNA threonylcarbamoyladenosine dehydratase [Clostridiales bacterium]
MDERFSRSAMLIGEGSLNRLTSCHVAVFGLGGVGGYAAEALARSGVGALDLVDGDSVGLSNLNRQIIALQSSLGQNKAELMRQRALLINPQIRATAISLFYTAQSADSFDFSKYDYILDCVDMVTAKVQLALHARSARVPLITALGAGNKLDPAQLEVADLHDTSMCPLARALRKLLRPHGIEHLKVVYSREQPRTPATPPSQEAAGRRGLPGSMVFVPAAMGLLMAAEVVKDLLIEQTGPETGTTKDRP